MLQQEWDAVAVVATVGDDEAFDVVADHWE